MPYVQSRPNSAAAAALLGVAGTMALSATGHGQAALALLSALGATAGILFATGQLEFKRYHTGIDDRIGGILNALPTAVAVTGKRGTILWLNEAFADAVEPLNLKGDLSRLGNGSPEIAAAIFRLLAAARSRKPHAETIALPKFVKGEPVTLKVMPYIEPGRQLRLIWQIETASGGLQHRAFGPNAVEALPVPALIVGSSLRVEAANKAFEKFAGFAATGKEVWTLFRAPRGNVLTQGKLRDIVAKGGAGVSVHVASEGGGGRAAVLHVVPRPGGAHDVIGSQLWIVTPRNASSESLSDAFEALLERSPAAMAIMSAEGVIHAANAAFRRLFSDGLGVNDTGAAVTGKHIGSLVASASAQTVRDKIARLSAERGAITAEIVAELKSAPGKGVRLAIFPATNQSDLIVSAVEAGAAALIDEQAAQSQKLQAVGELAGGIAHDFNNLLTAIIGFSDLLLRRFRASDPAFKDLMNIKNNATRAAELVKQILAYSRRQTLRPAILKFTDVIEEFQATMGRTLGEKVKAKVQHGRDLWFVKADEGQLFQVIMNLAVNARDAMQDGGEIAIRTANVTERESLGLKDRGLDRGEYVMCEVRDTGSGIRLDHLERIFDPFFSTKEVGKGTGLGLSTVYGIVKQTGGTIIVDSEIGVGTCFRIYLPRYHETEEDLKALESRANTTEKLVDLTGKGTVLLVEDEEAVRSFASRALATRGYTVLEAGSGVEALEIMDRENGQVDLVVSDVVMPEMDGPTLLRHLRERNPEIRIVFMSGYAEEAFRKNLNADEEFVFLPKPFTLKRLAETVKAASAPAMG